MKKFLLFIFSILTLQATELSIMQGYAQDKDEACSLSVNKVLKRVDESAIKTRCQCYRQDSRDWICYTYYEQKKKD